MLRVQRVYLLDKLKKERKEKNYFYLNVKNNKIKFFKKLYAIKSKYINR